MDHPWGYVLSIDPGWLSGFQQSCTNAAALQQLLSLEVHVPQVALFEEIP